MSSRSNSGVFGIFIVLFSFVVFIVAAEEMGEQFPPKSFPYLDLLQLQNTKEEFEAGQPEGRIVGGAEANKGQFPYQVSMKMYGRSFCGGTVYNSNTVITAAHCLFDRMSPFTLKQIKYVAGDHHLANSESSEQIRFGPKVIIHPNYKAEQQLNDIALVILSKPFQFNKYVQPLPISGVPAEQASKAVVSGWGYTEPGHNNMSPEHFPSILRAAKVNVFSRAQCLSMFTNQPDVNWILQNGGICAGEAASESKDWVNDSCQGDSGGPLACYNPKKKNQRYLCGIVSTGIGCGIPGYPGIYTRVADYEGWIAKVAGRPDPPTIGY